MSGQPSLAPETSELRLAGRVVAAALLLMAFTASAACDRSPRRLPQGPSPVSRTLAAQDEAGVALAKLEHQHARWPDDREVFIEAASTAWSFFDRHYQPSTGFVTVLGNFPLTTVWDVGSMLAAVYSARGLGLIDDATYEARIGRMLKTLAGLRLYDNAALSRVYDTRTGAMVEDRSGWSATDLGRLLIWLKIVSTDPRFADMAETVARRMDVKRIIQAGYLWGEDADGKGRVDRFQEGRIGYEQYAAKGFALWGYRAEKALSLTENALPISVMGQALVTDYRRWDRLTSEPFLLWGLELGWDRQVASLVNRLLLAQEERYRRTGFVTIPGEDAIPQAPYFFYYYCVYANGKEFSVDVQNDRAVVDGPRWVSAKSALAFHAITPTRYTDTAVRALRAARGPAGWASGVYEATGQSTGSININTAAVILTAALVHHRGEPLLPAASLPAGQ